MSEQANVQRIGAYAWSLVLAVAGGALIIGALAGSPEREPATVIATDVTPPAIVAADTDGAIHSRAEGAGITHITNTE